ncbi:MAG: nucleotidyltransferase family protein [Burkholderiaceae bacterium]|nr:nucleotidyltransferase family protein [Burkholderiaceae bacterium]
MEAIVPAGEVPARVGALLLAAGRSTRMGGPNKLLVEVDGEPMVRRALRTLLAVPLEPIVVVLGPAADAVRAALDGLHGWQACVAPESTDHQVSVDAGLRALPAGLDAILVMLADQPLLDAGDLRWLLAQWRSLARGCALVPVHQGRRANPVVLDAAMRAPILDAGPAVGARGYLAAHPALVRRAEAPNDHFVVDVDTVDDLARLAGRGLRSAIEKEG